MAESEPHQFSVVSDATPAVSLIRNEAHMRLLDVLRMLRPGKLTERDAFQLLCLFESLAPLRPEKGWGETIGFDTSISVVRDQRCVETWTDFTKLCEGNLEELYISAWWAGRMIEAVRKHKGLRTLAEYRPWNRLFGKPTWGAVIITNNPRVTPRM